MVSALLQFGANPASQNPEKKSSFEMANSDAMKKVFFRESLFSISKGEWVTYVYFFPALESRTSYICETLLIHFRLLAAKIV